MATHLMISRRESLAFFLPSLEGGGAERVILNLAAGFAQRGVPTDLVVGSFSGPYCDQIPPSVRVVDLNATRTLLSAGPLARYLRRARPQALLAALDHANLVAMAAGRFAREHTRMVISIHCTFPKKPQRPASLREAAIPWLLGHLHHWADGIIAVSQGVANDVATTTGIPRDRIDVIYNPVITPDLLPAAAQRPAHPWFEDPSRPIVLGVGRLVPQKNFPLLLEAFRAVGHRHNARLVILGEGPERPTLEKFVRTHDLQNSVSLPGFVENPYACMSRAAVFALSSDFEGLPTTLIESMALGTPVVATDCDSGPREILRGGELGELVPVGDAPALSHAIARALNRTSRNVPWEALRPFMLDVVLDRFQEAFRRHAYGSTSCCSGCSSSRRRGMRCRCHWWAP